MSVLQFPGRTAAQDAHPELGILSASQLIEFRSYYLWRIDTLFLLALSDTPWFEHGDRLEYHKKQLSEELAFCESSLREIEKRLKNIGV